MDYFSILNLDKEPFSNSPDPGFFFRSRQHVKCVQQLELSLRLRRGLNVVIGDVGTGKTTLCRQLIRGFASDEQIETHLILDPHYSNPSEFLAAVAEMFEGVKPACADNHWQMKEIIKQYLFRKGVEEKKTIVLIIDEGQKIPAFCLEILREFLNYETNEYKLLQTVIFAQKEFEETVRKYPNFADRINLYHHLESLNFWDTRSMIQFRLNQSKGSRGNFSLFTFPALWAIYLTTGGYPRKIMNLCHRCIMTMIIQNRSRVGWFLVRACIKRQNGVRSKRWRQVGAGAALTGLIVAATTAGPVPEGLKMLVRSENGGLQTANLRKDVPRFKGSLSQGYIDPVKARAAAVQHSQGSRKVAPTAPAGTGPTDPVQAPSEVSQEISPHASSEPPMLGRLSVRENEWLWWMITKVYGNFKHKRLEAVTLANPHINDPDHLEIGQSISFPAIPVTFKSLPREVWWVKVAEKDSLEAAFQLIRSYPPDAPAIRLIPYWNSQEGLRFAVVFEEYFFDEASARNQLSQLPPWVASRGKILSIWNGDTVFFADPFLAKTTVERIPSEG